MPGWLRWLYVWDRLRYYDDVPRSHGFMQDQRVPHTLRRLNTSFLVRTPGTSKARFRARRVISGCACCERCKRGSACANKLSREGWTAKPPGATRQPLSQAFRFGNRRRLHLKATLSVSEINRRMRMQCISCSHGVRRAWDVSRTSHRTMALLS